jgi:hypothetical protein
MMIAIFAALEDFGKARDLEMYGTSNSSNEHCATAQHFLEHEEGM